MRRLPDGELDPWVQTEWQDLEYYPGPLGYGLQWSDEQSDPISDLLEWVEKFHTYVPDRGLA